MCVNEKVDYVLRVYTQCTIFGWLRVKNTRSFGMTFDPSTEISNFTKECSSFSPIVSGGFYQREGEY